MASQKDAPETSPLRLDQFLKLSGVADTGGQAKWMIQNGEVKVNGEVETRRGRKMTAGDRVEVKGKRCRSAERRRLANLSPHHPHDRTPLRKREGTIQLIMLFPRRVDAE